LADSKKTKELDFEKELAPESIMGFGEIDGVIHRRRSSITLYNESRSLCEYFLFLYDEYKKGTQYSDICKKCLKSYSMEEIKLLKHFLIVQKLKGN